MPYLVTFPNRTASLPTSWSEVTLGQAQQIAALGDSAALQDCLAILLHGQVSELLTLSPKDLQAALLQATFLAEPMPERDDWPRPSSVWLDEVEVPVSDTLENILFGQAADIGGAIQQLGEDVTALRVRVLAILLQPAYAGTTYDSDAVAAMEPLCAALPLREALPLTDFFLPITTASGPLTTTDYTTFPSAPTSVPPASTPSAKNGIRWPSWMRWPAATKPGGTSSSAVSGLR